MRDFLGFNPTLVRLRLYDDCELGEWCLSFNPTLVRLRPYVWDGSHIS